MAANFGDIFLGVTPAGMRAYLVDAFGRLRGKYSKLILPCAGRFADGEVAVQAGWNPGDIEMSDIGLFSSTLGYSITGRPLADLGVRFHGELEAFNDYTGTDREAGAILLALKICQLKADNYYEGRVRKELLRVKDQYIDQLQGKVNALKAKLAGISYEIRDVTEHASANIDDPETLLYVSAPEYKGGYGKMFATHGLLTWNEPSIPEFDPTTREVLYKKLLEGKALSLIYRCQTLTPTLEGKAVFANQAGKRLDFVASNRPEELDLFVKLRSETAVAPVKIPLLPLDYEITEDSKISIIETKREHALYYRELFAHKLGVTRSESYFLMLIDGYIFGVFGMFFDKVGRGQSGTVHETFGFNVPSNRYPRLNRLLMSVLVSEQTRQFFQARMPTALREIDAFQTTCIASTPEVRANRGLLKVVDRHQRPDGRYHINYYASFKPWTWSDAVADWLQRMREQQKQTGRDLGVRHEAPPRKTGKPDRKDRATAGASASVAA